MNSAQQNDLLQQIVEQLSAPESLQGLFHAHRDGTPHPSSTALSEIVDHCRAIIFPGFYGASTISQQTIPYHIGTHIERLYALLSEQILAGIAFGCCSGGEICAKKAAALAADFVASLPRMRALLATDVEAAFNGDPAAESYGEVISCYPIIKAITNYRIAHQLYQQGVPIIPRIISEMAHSETGIDIHPAAQIGHHFTIDHGTGVVIGATCIIGNHVKLYQGVTLGAKSFPLDENGNPVKGVPRHPILEDNVLIYSNATILGRITLGKGTIVGGNLWVTESTAPGTKLVQSCQKK